MVETTTTRFDSEVGVFGPYGIHYDLSLPSNPTLQRGESGYSVRIVFYKEYGEGGCWGGGSGIAELIESRPSLPSNSTLRRGESDEEYGRGGQRGTSRVQTIWWMYPVLIQSIWHT